MLATEISRSAVPVTDPSTQDTSPSWKQVVTSAEPFLRSVADRLAAQIQSFDPQIADYAEYALTNQGKQLRPALLALSAGATGKLNDSHVVAAVVVEMVHLATLVHDDVMDEAKIRRGRPTMAANWGNQVSVLVGDCLFAHALKLAAGFPTTEVCRAVSAATNTVCSGEILQTQSRNNFELTRAEYFKMLQMKTGELFALSCDLGSYLSGAPANDRACLRQFGLAIGTAYQIFDDCVDLFGSEASAGKSLGTDLATGKVTLPVLLLLERVNAPEKRKMLALLQQSSGSVQDDLRRALALHETLSASRAVVHHHLRTASHCLSGLPDSESRAGLLSLTDYLGQQIDSLGQLTPV